MKNKNKRQFLKAYPWYDYSFLLQAMYDWLDNASKQTYNKGTHLNAHKIAKRMKIAGELCKRIKDYDELENINCVLYPNVSLGDTAELEDIDGYPLFILEHLPDEITYKRVTKLLYKQKERQLQEMKDMLFKILDKHLLNMWD